MAGIHDYIMSLPEQCDTEKSLPKFAWAAPNNGFCIWRGERNI